MKFLAIFLIAASARAADSKTSSSQALGIMMDASLTIAQRNDACYELRSVISPDVTKAMRAALDDPKLRSCAGENLRREGAVGELKDALSSDDFQVRALAARELGSFEKPELLPLLAATARDSQMIVAMNAVEGLAEYHDPAVIPYLLEVARSGGLAGAAALNRALAFHDSRTLAVARELVASKDVSDQLAAMAALCEIGDSTDLPKLREIEEKETGTLSSAGRGFGLMPPISLSRAAKTAIAAIEGRENSGDKFTSENRPR